MSEWTPVTDAAGEVAGWMSAPDPGEDPDGDYFTADRLPKIRRRAAAIDQAADLLMAESFDVKDVCESAKAQMGYDALAAALGVAYELLMIEQERM